MVRRFVEEQDVGIREQEPRNRDTSTLATREDANLLVAVRAAEVRHTALDEVLKIPVVVRIDDGLQPFHFRRGLRIIKVAAEVLVLLDHRLRVRDALHHRLEDGLGVVECRLLRQVPDLGPLRDLHGAHELGVESREDLQERRLAGAVPADDANVRPIEERKVDVLQDRLRPLLLRDINQTELIFSCHFILLS